MSVGKNSIKRAACKTVAPASSKAAAKPAPKKETIAADEVKNAAPELANSCSTPASPVKKPAAKKPAAKKPAAPKAEAAKAAPKASAVKAEAEIPAAPKAEEKKGAEGAVAVTQEMPYWLL